MLTSAGSLSWSQPHYHWFLITLAPTAVIPKLLHSPIPNPSLHFLTLGGALLDFSEKTETYDFTLFTSTFLAHVALLWSQITQSSSFSPAYSATLPLEWNESVSSLPSPACPYMPPALGLGLGFFSLHFHSWPRFTRNCLFHSFP